MCHVAQLEEHQYGKLEVCYLNPGFDTDFSLNIYHLYNGLFAIRDLHLFN